MTTAAGTRTRILVGAASFDDARTAMRMAELLAAHLPAEMGGILIDDTALADLARLPSQRVITPGGALTVLPSAREIESLLAGDARAFQRMLVELARQHTLKWSFERRQGELIGGLCEAARGWDVLLLGYRALHKRRGRVVLLAPDETLPARADALAHTLAHALATEMLTVRPGNNATFADGHHEHTDLDALLMRIGRLNAAAVVLDLDAGPLRTHDALRQLLHAARCPLLVLGVH